MDMKEHMTCIRKSNKQNLLILADGQDLRPFKQNLKRIHKFHYMMLAVSPMGVLQHQQKLID